jgi:hypothetical protein
LAFLNNLARGKKPHCSMPVDKLIPFAAIGILHTIFVDIFIPQKI